MANIPRVIAQRSLDTGNVVQYPNSTPVGDAIQRAGSMLQGVAGRFKEMQDKKDGFDAAILEDQLLADTQQMELDAERNAPVDGKGLHDSVYGEIVPGPNGQEQVAKPGSFDTLFDNYLTRVPESKRQEFAAKKELYRQRGSVRLGTVQYKAQQDYYKLEIQKSQNNVINAISLMDPNDNATYETYRNNVLELIDKSDLPAIERDIAKANWEANAEIALAESFIANDPDGPTKVRGWLGFGEPETAASGSAGSDGAVSLLRKFEGFRSGTYWDVNAHRVGYGSDTITRADGSVSRVKQGDTVSRADAERDLSRRVAEFERTAATKVGAGWATLPGNVKAALTSITYNYGRLPANVAAAAQSGDAESIAKAVEALKWHNNGVNAKRRQEEANIIRGTENVPPSEPRTVDPRFASMTVEQRQILANKAAVAADSNAKAKIASDNAAYGQYKDAIELQIVRGEIRDEELVFNDPSLKAGDKATLIKSLRTQNESANQITSDFSALSSGSLALDPYASKDKTRADNLYAEAVKRLPPEQHSAIAGAILNQTGVVPQPVVNTIRKGLASDNPADVMNAAQLAQRIASFDQAALARRDGGGEVQTAADDFAFYVNKMNLDPPEAAQRIIDGRSPEGKFTRKAMEGAAKEFVKAVEKEDVAAIFDDSWFSDPVVGFSEGQRLGIQAEYVAIAEDQFYAANGDPELAKNRAAEQMKRLYGVTEMTGRKVVMKHPPERYWPKFEVAGAAQSLSYPTQLREAVLEADPTANLDTIELVTTAGTDAMVKKKEMPGYAVMWKDPNGNYQTLPGKLWAPDISKLQQMQQTIEETGTADELDKARANQVQERQKAPYNVQKPDDFLSGEDPLFGPR